MPPSNDSHPNTPAWSSPAYWQDRFATGDTPWELHHPSTVLSEALGELKSFGVHVSGARVLSPGCGSGEDALELMRRGADVTAVDWSHEAVSRLSEKIVTLDDASRSRIHVCEGDLFSVGPHGFDLVAEHTFFCAIDPSQRPTYAHTMAQVVKRGGYIVGNFFVLGEDDFRDLHGASLSAQGGPPFAITARELREVLHPMFVLRRPRGDLEWSGWGSLSGSKGPR